MSTSLRALVPELQEAAQALVDLAGRAGVLPRVTSTLRSRAEQARLYRKYLAGATAYPAAPPGTSAHEYGEAFDIVVATQEDLYDLGSVWTSWGGSWGGQRDPVHFELPGASARARRALQAPVAPRPWTHTLAIAADIILGFNPYIGALELASTLIGLGYPENEVLQFLSGPFEYLSQ